MGARLRGRARSMRAAVPCCAPFALVGAPKGHPATAIAPARVRERPRHYARWPGTLTVPVRACAREATTSP